MLFYSHLIITREQDGGQNPSLSTRAHQTLDKKICEVELFAGVALIVRQNFRPNFQKNLTDEASSQHRQLNKSFYHLLLRPPKSYDGKALIPLDFVTILIKNTV